MKQFSSFVVGFFVFIMLFVGTLFAQAWMFMFLFNEFISGTFQFTSISFAQAFGMMLLVAFLKYRSQKEEITLLEAVKQIGSLYAFYISTILFALIIKLFI